MEILNQLLSNQADYLNALRHAQQMPVAPPPDPGNNPKFNLNGKIIIRLLTAAGIFYIGYKLYKSLATDPSANED
jgi:hypothetical protein